MLTCIINFIYVKAILQNFGKIRNNTTHL